MTDKPTEDLPQNRKEFIRIIQKNPDKIIPLLKIRDPRLYYLFKRHKIRSLDFNQYTRTEDCIQSLMQNPYTRFNKRLWMSLKSSLLFSRKDLESRLGCRFRKTFPGRTEDRFCYGDFFLWLLREGGVSPHHCRQLLLYDHKICTYFGLNPEERSPCDLLYFMHYLLRNKKGGAKEIFNLSRLWWIYRKQIEKEEEMTNYFTRLIRDSV
jgi:hypothetical protein